MADIARDLGALTVGIVTKPFMFEGQQRRAIAEAGLEEMIERVDTIITIPNDRLLQVIDKKTSLIDAFRVVDDVLHQGVQGISELITVPGLINVDFADVKAIMHGAGSALMGIGRGSGENRAIDAAKAAIDSPLLEMSIDGARGILFTITGSSDLGMYEINEAAKIITGAADEDAKVIFGAVINDDMKDEVKITVVATGFEGSSRTRERQDAEAVRRVRDLENLEALDTKRAVFFERESVSGIGSGGTLARESGLEREAGRDDDQEELEIPAFIRKKMH